MDAIHTLFGSALRVKIIRLFLFNPETGFSLSSLSERTQGSIRKVRKEIPLLLKSGLIKKKLVTDIARKSRRATHGYVLNSAFPHIDALYTFILDTTKLSDRHVLTKISRLGKVKLIVIAGAFVKQWDSRIDLLIVGDEIKEKELLKTLKSIEADMGRELRFSYLSLSDFSYRISVYDRLLRDVLDYPHKILLDRIGIASPKPIRLLSTVGEGAL